MIGMHKVSAEPTKSAHVARAKEYPAPIVESIAVKILSTNRTRSEKNRYFAGSQGEMFFNRFANIYTTIKLARHHINLNSQISLYSGRSSFTRLQRRIGHCPAYPG